MHEYYSTAMTKCVPHDTPVHKMYLVHMCFTADDVLHFF